MIKPNSKITILAESPPAECVKKWSYSTIEIKAAQAPPIPLKKETICGIWVICTRLAIKVPTMEPRIKAPKIQG